jgi:iron complex outermembrane recepter protein
MKRSLTLILLLFSLAGYTWAQNTLKGQIKDSEGDPLFGATVQIKNSKAYALTDAEGKFSVTFSEVLPVTLVVSYVGYEPAEVSITEITDQSVNITLLDVSALSEVVITARRREETVQEVPIPISVLKGALIEESGAFNVNRLKEFVPSVQLYSSNPRNTTLNIRGLGSTFGLTNDGIDPGVGFYIDGVYYVRPAATTLDFIDVERVEVLRGPQGTLFGKNTTSGAFNITTRKPSFSPAATFETSFGNYGFVQAKSSITGPLSDKLAARISFSGTQRNGLIENVRTEKSVNDINNLGVRGQLLYVPNGNVNILFIGDFTRQRPDGFAQVIAGVAPTKRARYRQFDSIIADLGYSLPSTNPFDRVVDHDTPWKSGNDIGGASVNIDIKAGPGTLTATSAYRIWNWDPSNDRDFTGLPVLTKSQATSKHRNWSQEIRYAGDFLDKLSGVVGVFLLGQDLKTDPFHIEESGAAQWRFSQSTTSPLWATPGLFEGYGIKTNSRLQSFSGAVFGQLDWEIVKGLHFLPGIRFNYDSKKVDFDRQTYGGLQTTDSALLELKRLVYTNQQFNADVKKSNISGQATLSYRPFEQLNTFFTYAYSYKPVGVNLGGLPTANGQVLVELATIKPEAVQHFEIGIKSNPSKNSTLNLTLYNTSVKDYQTQVQSPEIGVNRGYLANAEKIRVRGFELDGNIQIKKNLILYGNLAFTDGKYITFTNAPLPLEETGLTVDGKQVAFKDISGSELPGISKWSGAVGGEYSFTGNLIKKQGKYFFAVDSYFRSGFSSSPTPSAYLNIDGYALLNARIGFRSVNGPSITLWGRNLLNKDYFEQLLPAGGNAGHYAGVLGDQLTFGVTLKYTIIK